MTYDEIQQMREKENKKFDTMILELQNKCSHKYNDGTTAIEEHCDDNDCDSWRLPNYETWKVCKICNKQIKKRHLNFYYMKKGKKEI